MKELELLQERLQQLIKQYAALKADADRLKKANDKQAAIIADQQNTIEEVQRELQRKAVILSASDAEAEKENLKQHLDRVIRELEKNIESL
ncbi:MAG TPA: hypothetical protein VGB84_05115 [Arachidicoccus sp.]